MSYSGTGTFFKVDSVFQYTTPLGLKHFGPHPIYTCFITISPVDLNATYNPANDAVVVDVSAAIQASARNGKIPVLLDVGFVAPGLEGANVVGGKDFTLANDNLGFTFTLTASDLTTERGSAIMSAFTESIGLVVTYYEYN
jgi:hypothetical protein